MTLTTIPAHAFEPAKRANPNGPGLVDDPMCGYLHKIGDGNEFGDGAGVFCAETADAPVHHGAAQKVRVREWTDAEIEAGNR
ncbi:hypothetical protein FHR83_006660 [Actinoplanes campanulatus]|uniref:Uncharacterized protein n=1 Tax=Actinoplanes campanulatus TaxID=113559 RepID=A0A7W5ANC6_9ACTN|nr:hypothetical protein [Actinoplanes campanulatus]MBB3098954.1 hypothetical protein [Actinoplanes campanulatus]GGN39702.1 hypothetical protein GCM10010109_67960 [Actinoplanes campanulatus]